MDNINQLPRTEDGLQPIHQLGWSMVTGKGYNFPEVRWKCLRCATCCGDTPFKNRRIRLLPLEAKSIAEAINQPIEAFSKGIKGHEPYLFEMKKNRGKCVFLRGKECQIYDIRPLVCRFYPFWLKRGKDGRFSFEVTSECPGIGLGRKLGERFFEDFFREFRKSLSPTFSII